jgi:hypothetical protein
VVIFWERSNLVLFLELFSAILKHVFSFLLDRFDEAETECCHTARKGMERRGGKALCSFRVGGRVKWHVELLNSQISWISGHQRADPVS